MSNTITEDFKEILQAIAELPEETRKSEIMCHVLEAIESGIASYRQKRLEDALRAFNDALSYLRTIEARRLEYHVLKRARSLYYEMGRPADELDYFYR